EIRPAYFAARERLLAAANEAQRATVAREQAAVVLRLGKAAGFAAPTAPVEGDAGRLEAERNRAIGDIDRRLQTFNAEYRRQAQAVQQLKNDLIAIEMERDKYADTPEDPFALQLARGSKIRVEACRLAADNAL